MDCCCLVIQEAMTGWWNEDAKVELMLEHWRVDRLLEEVENK